MSWPEEIRAQARELYCSDGLTYEQVTQRTGVPLRTLHLWGRQEFWRGRREKIAENLATIHEQTIELRRRLISGVLKSLEGGVDPQKIFAVSALEGATAKLAAQGPSMLPEVQAEPREIRTPADAVDALEEAVELEVNRLLTQPGSISLGRIRELKQTMDYVRDLKRDLDGPKTEAQAGLTEAAAAELRDKILGL